MRTHGHTAWGQWSPTYMSWKSMHMRCKNQKCNDYDRYGGAGITVCERWKDFSNFLEDMGERPSGYVLDRLDSKGNYEPANCRWATWTESANNRKNTAFVLFKGKRLPAAEVERKTGWQKGTARRLSRRAEPGQDLTTVRWGQIGTDNPASKCTDEMVRSIRSMDGSLREIAKHMGLSRYCVWAIRKRKTWKHIL